MLQGSLEDNIITLLCWSEEHASALTLQITPELFSTRHYRKVADRAFKYIHQYNRAPGVHLRDILEKDLQRGDEGRLLNQLLMDMEGLQPHLQPLYVLDQLNRWISLRKISMAAEEAMESVHNGDLEKAEAALYNREPSRAHSAGIWLHDPEAMLRFMDRGEDDYFPSGIDILDQRGVRPGRKQLFVIIGPKKSGKSRWMIEIGKQAIMHRKSVLHISLENGEDFTARLYTQSLFALAWGKAETIRIPIFRKDQLGRFTKMDFDTRVAAALNDGTRKQVVEKLKALSSRKLLIKEFPTGGLTIPQLNAYLDALERQDKFKPDILLVDSGNKMKIRGDHTRTDLGETFIGLRGIAVDRNIAVVSPTHSNRQGDQAHTVNGAAHIGEDYSLLGTADAVCTISRTSAERDIGLARILVDAAREVEDKWVALITQNFATGQFCLDSVYFNKYAEEEINRVSGVDKQ